VRPRWGGRVGHAAASLGVSVGAAAVALGISFAIMQFTGGPPVAAA